MERISAPLQGAVELRTADRIVEQAVDARTRLARENAWMDLPEFRPSPQAIAASRIVTLDRSNPAHAAFDMIRTRVLQSLRQNGWTSVAITSPTPDCGKSLVALNLAFSLAHQKDCRTMLIDLDLRHPSLGKLLDIKEPPSMEAFLKGNSDLKETFRRYDKNLAIGVSRRPARYSSELLQSFEAARVLRDMKQAMSPDVVLYDLTSMLPSDDVTAFLPNVDCAILVAGAEHSTFDEVDACERDLAERTNLLGVVLNKCRL